MSNILRNETRHIMRQGAFLPDTDVKSLEPPLATLIMAEKRQVICQTTRSAVHFAIRGSIPFSICRYLPIRLINIRKADVVL